MAIGNIGTGNISTLAKLNTGRDNLQVAFGCTGNAPAAKRSGCLSAKREPRRGRKGPRQHRFVYFAERKAEYGKAVLRDLARRLTAEYGSGYDESNLRYMRLFYLAFPIRDALRHELSWTHYRSLRQEERQDQTA